MRKKEGIIDLRKISERKISECGKSFQIRHLVAGV